MWQSSAIPKDCRVRWPVKSAYTFPCTRNHTACCTVEVLIEVKLQSTPLSPQRAPIQDADGVARRDCAGALALGLWRRLAKFKVTELTSSRVGMAKATCGPEISRHVVTNKHVWEWKWSCTASEPASCFKASYIHHMVVLTAEHQAAP